MANEQENLSKDAMWRQLQNAIQMAIAANQSLWNISSIFWAANALLIVALLPKGKPEPEADFYISLVGVFTSVVWVIGESRAVGHLRRYEKLVERLEGLLMGSQPEYATSAEINKLDYCKYLGKGPKQRGAFVYFRIGAIVFWTLFLGYFLLKLLSCSPNLPWC